MNILLIHLLFNMNFSFIIHEFMIYEFIIIHLLMLLIYYWLVHCLLIDYHQFHSLFTMNWWAYSLVYYVSILLLSIVY